MNLKLALTDKEQKLLIDAGIKIENKDYSEEEIQKCETQILDYIMSQSKNNIHKTKEKYDSILRSIEI